jgi:hypothetical protein
MFEKGNPIALSESKVAALAELLGVDLASATQRIALPPQRPTVALLWLCANPHCPGNLPYAIRGRLRFAPAMLRAAVEGLRCRYCSEPMHSECPACQEPLLAEGLFCTNPACGEPLVSLPDDEQEQAALLASADAERAYRIEIRRATQARNCPLVGGRSREDTGQANQPSDRAEPPA